MLKHTATPKSTRHSDTMLAQFDEFRKNRQLTDVVLHCVGSSIPAHKSVLAAASPFFLAMFSGHFPESAQHEIELHEMDEAGLQLVIDFIYTGQLAISADRVQQLMETGAFLQLTPVVDLCAEYMVKHLLDADNCLGFRHFGEKHSNELLLQATNDFIVKYFKYVKRTEEFLEISFEELSTLLSIDKIIEYSDYVVLRAVMRWVKHKRAERLPQLAALLLYINPVYVSAQVAAEQPLLQEEDTGAQEWLSDVMQSNSYGAGDAQWHIFALNKRPVHERKMHRFRVLEPDFEDGAKSALTVNAMVQLNPLPSPAYGASLAAFKNVLYVQGGSEDRNPNDDFYQKARKVGRSRRDSFYYDIYRNKWDSMQPLMLERSFHRSLVLGESLYALGGNGLQGPTGAVECRNLITDKSAFRESMLVERCSMGAVACEKEIYVMGGIMDDKIVYLAERYDPRVGNWQKLPALREQHSYHSSAAIDSAQQIYCCPTGNESSMERFDLRANKWETIEYCETYAVSEIFTVDSQLFSLRDEELLRYDMTANEWLRVHKFRMASGHQVKKDEDVFVWDAVAALPMRNYSIKK